MATISKASALLDLLNTQRASLPSAIDSHRSKADGSLGLVALTENRLLVVRNAASSLGFIMDHCCAPSERVSDAIKYSKDALVKSNALCHFAETTQVLKDAIADIYSNMAVRNWENAARAAHTALSVPEEIRFSQFAAQMVPSAELPGAPQESIDSACKEMIELFSREFETAIKENDAANITFYFKLLPLVGAGEQGLYLYSRYVRSAVSVRSRQLIRGGLSSGGEFAGHSTVYGIAIARLFETIAIILEQHAQLVTLHYGQDAMIKVIKEIQNEIDAQAGLIIDTWWDERRLDRCLAEVKFYSYPILVSTISMTPLKPEDQEHSGVLDLNEVGKLLNELAMMLNRWNLYCSFIKSRWSADEVIAKSQLTRKVTEMLDSAFSTLSIFVLRRTLEKAIEMDELPDLDFEDEDEEGQQLETPPVSSMADDMLFVLNSLFNQMCESGNIHILNSVVPSFQRIIESDYCGVVQQQLRSISASQLRLAAPNPKVVNYLIWLNNLIYTRESTCAIVSRVQFDDLDFCDEYQKTLMMLSNKLGDAVSSRVDSIVKECLRGLFTAALLPQLKNLMSRLLPSSYMMTAAEPESFVGEKFQLQWEMIMRAYRIYGHPEAYNYLAQLSASALATLWERHIWSLKGKINELGSIALDRDLSRVMSIVSTTDYSHREKFVRIAQIVMIVCEEDENQAAEYSELSQADIAAAKSLRAE